VRPSKTRHRERRTDRDRERGILIAFAFSFLLYLRPIYQFISPFLCFSEAHDSAFHLLLLLVSRTREKKKKRENSKKNNISLVKKKQRSRTRNSQFEDLDTCDRQQLISIAAWNTLAAYFFSCDFFGWIMF
jgi:hypothetical protein